MRQSEFFKKYGKLLLLAVAHYQNKSDKKEIREAIKVIKEKIDDLRIIELEEKASSGCWEYCHEQGFTETEREEYDKLVYGEE